MANQYNEDKLYELANSILIGDSKPEGKKMTYRKGDIIINIGETMDTEPIFICVKGGTPGEWLAIGGGGAASGDVPADIDIEAIVARVKEEMDLVQGPQGEVGPQGPKGEDGYTPVKGVDYFTEEELKELMYNDSEIRELIDEEKPYLADVTAYPTSKFLFACGQPMTVEPNTGFKYNENYPEDAVAFVYRWTEGFECIMVEKEEAAKVYLVGGYGDKNVGARRSIPQTNMKVRDVKIKGLVGGNYFEGMVGHVNIEAENCEFVTVMGGGWCGAPVNNNATRMNVADDISIKMTNCKVSSTLFGGSQGNGVSDDVYLELNNCEIGWLTAGGSNGMTRNAVVEMNGGNVKVVQSINRGIVYNARFVLNDGTVEKLYFGGETEDSSVNGIIENGFVELNGGKVNKFCFGTNNGIEMIVEDIKGTIMDCVVAEGDVSMLEKVEKEPEVKFNFNENGELVVTINGISKIFVPKE